jgi:hypothetical protein
MRVVLRQKSSLMAFMHPLDPAPKTAILTPGFRESRHIRVFARGWNAEAHRFRPTAIAGTLAQLLLAAQSGLQLSHAVIVLNYSALPGVPQHDREILWDSFGVPVFEQWLRPNNELLAAECEAHDGLHLVAPNVDYPLEHQPCACGSGALRLASVEIGNAALVS